MFPGISLTMKNEVYFENYNRINDFSFIFFLKNTFLVFLSFFNLIFFRKFDKAIYFIANNSYNKSLIDARSETYVKELDLISSLNFIRCNNFATCLRIFFILPNVIFIQSFYYFYYYYFCIFKSNKNYKLLSIRSEQFQKKVIFYFFKRYKINNFVSIDDYRIIHNFLYVCKKLKVKSVGYMHGRFSKLQNTLKYYQFDKYYVWSNFFKNSLINFFPKYKNKEIVVKNFSKVHLYPYFRPQIKSSKYNVLFILEKNTNDNLIKKYLLSLSKKNVVIFIKPRINEKINAAIRDLLSMKNVKLIKSTNSFLNILENNNIMAVIASNSTALLECSYFNIYPIMIKSGNNYSRDFISNKLVFYFPKHKNFGDHFIKLFQSFKNKKRLDNIRKKIWLN
jgi:hypothetical protein